MWANEPIHERAQLCWISALWYLHGKTTTTNWLTGFLNALNSFDTPSTSHNRVTATRHQRVCHKSWTALAMSEKSINGAFVRLLRHVRFLQWAECEWNRVLRRFSYCVCVCWNNGDWRRKLLWQAVVTNLLYTTLFCFVRCALEQNFLYVLLDNKGSDALEHNLLKCCAFSHVKQICFGNFIS